jgi:multidrug resistance efflux pump
LTDAVDAALAGKATDQQWRMLSTYQWVSSEALPYSPAQLLDVERKLAALDERHAQESVQTERLYHSSVHKLRKRRALIERRIRSQRRGVDRLTVRAERFRTLADEGLSDHGATEDASEALDNAERAWLALQDQLALADVELSKLDREREAGRAARQEERERTIAERDAVRVLLEETEIRASHAGKLEGLRVSVGQQVQPGGALARLVPLGAPERVVAFMPERDRAFLREGRAVRLELDRLPVGEFGSLVARVARISNDVAAADEIETHLGQKAEGTLFRVDLSLERAQPKPELLQYLQSGTLVTVRAPLRSRRIVELLFDPIRRFLKE